MIFVDTNVVIDVIENDERWADWSIVRLEDAAVTGVVVVNAIVIAELSRDFADLATLQSRLADLQIVVEPINDRAAFLAGRRFVDARQHRDRVEAARPLPDFFIGAHALTLGCSLLTRDARLYRRYFPDLLLITPETHP